MRTGEKYGINPHVLIITEVSLLFLYFKSAALYIIYETKQFTRPLLIYAGVHYHALEIRPLAMLWGYGYETTAF